MARLIQQALFDLPENTSARNRPDASRHDKKPAPVSVPHRQTSKRATADQDTKQDATEVGTHAKQARARSRIERFLAEKMTSSQGQTASAQARVRLEQEYTTDLLDGQPLTAADPTEHGAAGDDGSSGLTTRSTDAKADRQARWQILPGALSLALADYPPDLLFTRGFWRRLRELVGRHEVCFAPDCRPLLERSGLFDLRAPKVFGTAPIRVETSVDPSVPTGDGDRSLVDLMRFMRDAGGF